MFSVHKFYDANALWLHLMPSICVQIGLYRYIKLSHLSIFPPFANICHQEKIKVGKILFRWIGTVMCVCLTLRRSIIYISMCTDSSNWHSINVGRRANCIYKSMIEQTNWTVQRHYNGNHFYFVMMVLLIIPNRPVGGQWPLQSFIH